MQRTVQMRTSFLVYGYPSGASGGEVRNVQVRVFDHQVAIQWQISIFSQRLYNRRAHGEIGDKMSVHDIYMDHRATARAGSVDLLRQPGKIG